MDWWISACRHPEIQLYLQVAYLKSFPFHRRVSIANSWCTTSQTVTPSKRDVSHVVLSGHVICIEIKVGYIHAGDIMWWTLVTGWTCGQRVSCKKNSYLLPRKVFYSRCDQVHIAVCVEKFLIIICGSKTEEATVWPHSAVRSVYSEL